MAGSTRVLNFRPRLERKPVVRWAFSHDLQAWVASGGGRSIAAVSVHGRVSKQLNEGMIYAALFRGVR
ncbi:MAG TPA: hypothetical protein VHY84_14845 [Bryobacteraceae bacterium]|jgi:hypothetical protein|nr:hypothetical protein [Bryobacteraceae bacterium]